MTILLRISWPPPALSSNARVHWAKRAKATRAYRREAGAVGQAMGLRRSPNANAVLKFTFYPPDRRHRDAHNMPAMMKPAIDGIADAMGVDDQFFECRFPGRLEAPVKRGAVLIEVETQ